MSLDQYEQAPISPFYIQKHVNDPIELGSLPVTFELDGKQISTDIHGEILFKPGDEVRLKLDLDKLGEPAEKLWMISDFSNFVITTDGGSIDCNCIDLQVKFPGTSTVTLAPKHSVMNVLCSDIPNKQMYFHVFNLPTMFGPDDYILAREQGKSFQRLNRSIIRLSGWRVTLCAHENTEALIEEREKLNGYAITHTGLLEREDGSTFDWQAGNEIILMLHYLMSFAFGQWIGTGLVVGLDHTGKRVYESWGLPRTDVVKWAAGFAWFDTHHSEILTLFAPGFYTAWQSVTWNGALKAIIYWYLASNSRGTGIGMDAGLILGQTALETLAWVYCVQDKHILAEADFESGGLGAAARIRTLAENLKIPLAVPPHYTALANEPLTHNKDMAGVIVKVRNALVHPSKEIKLDRMVYYETWQCAQWLIEMVILGVCGYRGQYANRINTNEWQGVVEPVPWIS